MSSITQQTGFIAEEAACQYLTEQGLILKEKNFRCPQGEIDLIMKDQTYLIFVEVRFRTQSDFGNSIETISYVKQRRLTRTALHYLQQHSLMDKVPCRFDVLGMTKEQNIVWIQNAFQVQY